MLCFRFSLAKFATFIWNLDHTFFQNDYEDGTCRTVLALAFSKQRLIWADGFVRFHLSLAKKMTSNKCAALRTCGFKNFFRVQTFHPTRGVWGSPSTEMWRCQIHFCWFEDLWNGWSLWFKIELWDFIMNRGFLVACRTIQHSLKWPSIFRTASRRSSPSLSLGLWKRLKSVPFFFGGYVAKLLGIALVCISLCGCVSPRSTKAHQGQVLASLEALWREVEVVGQGLENKHHSIDDLTISDELSKDPKWKQELEKVKEKRPPFVFFDAHICVSALLTYYVDMQAAHVKIERGTTELLRCTRAWLTVWQHIHLRRTYSSVEQQKVKGVVLVCCLQTFWVWNIRVQ